MKKPFLLLFLLGATFLTAKADTLTMNLRVGVLSDSIGTAITNGSLLQIIASPDTTFSAPTSDSFLGSNSNDFLLKSISFDSSSTGVDGAMQIAITVDLADYQTSITGDYFVIRWFPSLDVDTVTPGTTSFGEFGYPTDISWIIGSAGSSTPYSFRTTSVGGPYPDSDGNAVHITAVPEPSSYAAIIAFFSLGLLIKHGWRRAKSAA
jgi:hypothetical protein